MFKHSVKLMYLESVESVEQMASSGAREVSRASSHDRAAWPGLPGEMFV